MFYYSSNCVIMFLIIVVETKAANAVLDYTVRLKKDVLTKVFCKRKVGGGEISLATLTSFFVLSPPVHLVQDDGRGDCHRQV